MKRSIVLALGLCFAGSLLPMFPSDADAQVRFRRPYDGGYRLGYGFDNDGGAGGCRDYNCGSACYNGHTGEDFATPRGTVVRAAAAGRVVSRHNGCANTGYVGNTCGGRCGNYVQVEHDEGPRTSNPNCRPTVQLHLQHLPLPDH